MLVQELIQVRIQMLIQMLVQTGVKHTYDINFETVGGAWSMP